MKDLRENKNPFTINGYLGRKWYFILGIIIAAINGVLQFTLCRSIFTGNNAAYTCRKMVIAYMKY